MSHDNIYSENVKELLGEKLLAAKIHAESLKKETALAEHAQKKWDELSKYVKSEWFFNIKDLLNKERPFFSQQKIDDDTIKIVLDEIEKIAAEKTESIKRRFPSLMEIEFKDSKISLDKDSRHPKYTFENGFFTVEIDEYRGIARVKDTESNLGEIPADIGAIHLFLQRERTRIFERPFVAEQFFKQLLRNYYWIIRNEKLKEGDSIPIRKITKRLGRNEKGFRTDEFVFDLSRLISQGPSELDGIRMDTQQTRNITQGVFIQGPLQGMYIGFITFRKV